MRPTGPGVVIHPRGRNVTRDVDPVEDYGFIEYESNYGIQDIA